MTHRLTIQPEDLRATQLGENVRTIGANVLANDPDNQLFDNTPRVVGQFDLTDATPRQRSA